LISFLFSSQKVNPFLEKSKKEQLLFTTTSLCLWGFIRFFSFFALFVFSVVKNNCSFEIQ